MKPYALLLLLAGCASPDRQMPHWNDYLHITRPTEYVAALPSGLSGYSKFEAHGHFLVCTPQVSVYLTGKQRRCAESHERIVHCERGLLHSEDAGSAFMDCGDGTVYPSYNDNWPIEWSVMGMMPR